MHHIAINLIFLTVFCLLSIPAGVLAGRTDRSEDAPLKALAKSGPTPRTSDGHPDLSRVWFHGLVGKSVEGHLPAALREFDPRGEDPPPF
jgi:hypothetical protein